MSLGLGQAGVGFNVGPAPDALAGADHSSAPDTRADAIDSTAMGAVDTMELFFERLNAGDREGAVALMDERAEMRVHVGDNVQTLVGRDRVGGWFLRADAGLKMIPGEVRDLGNTYQADLLVIRPGAPSQHIDASSGSRQDGSSPSTSPREPKGQLTAAPRSEATWPWVRFGGGQPPGWGLGRAALTAAPRPLGLRPIPGLRPGALGGAALTGRRPRSG